MHIAIKNWLDSEEVVTQARKHANEMERKAALAEIPDNIRTAVPSDIVEGAVIWYPEHRDDSDELYPVSGWELVAEVFRPSDNFKAYTSHSGCRYGLDGAFVEITD